VADNGVVIIGGRTIGYTERNVHVYWDIAPDLITERTFHTPMPYYLIPNSRYVTHEHIQHVYITRWCHVEYDPQPISERHIFMHYALCAHSERKIYYYPDTRERWVFSECLLQNTPLLLKYPKYYNWNYIPQILNPEFILWSFYHIDESDIALQLMGSTGTNIYLNSGTAPDKFDIIQIAPDQFKITVHVDHVFEPNETVTCYLTAYDIKGNYLKPGMW